MGRPLVIGPGRNDRLNPALDQQSPGSIAVIGPVGNQPVWSFTRTPRPVRTRHCDCVERRVEEPDFRRGRRVQVCSQRSTRAITRTIHFVPFPRLGGPTVAPPFSPVRNSRRRNTRSSAASGRHSIGPTRPATASAARRWLPSPAAVASICWGCHTVWAIRSRARQFTVSRESRRSSAVHR